MIDFENDSLQLQIQKIDDATFPHCTKIQTTILHTVNILNQFRRRLEDGMPLTEKQQKFCLGLMRHLNNISEDAANDSSENVIYKPDDDTLRDIAIIITKYNMMSAYSLRYTSAYTLHALERLHTWFNNPTRSTIGLAKNDIKVGLKWANGTLKKIKNPKFEIGELAYYRDNLDNNTTYKPVVVISAPYITPMSKAIGRLTLVVDVLYESRIQQISLDHIFRRIPRQK